MRDPSQEGSFGFYKKARQDSEAHAGGSYTQMWNCLSDEKIAISLVVTAPPADNQDVAYSNERNLLIAIYVCDPSLQGLCQDIFTSIKEIGTLSQTLIYARYPYHMGERLQKLCKVLNTVPVENQKSSAKVVPRKRRYCSRISVAANHRLNRCCATQVLKWRKWHERSANETSAPFYRRCGVPEMQ